MRTPNLNRQFNELKGMKSSKKSTMEHVSDSEIPQPLSAQLAEDEIEALTRQLEGRPQVTVFGLLLTCLSIVLYIYDTYTDASVAFKYFNTGLMTYFWLTITFVFIPALVTTFFSAMLYYFDSQIQEAARATCGQKFMRWLFSVLLIGPVLRDINVLNYGIRSALALKEGDLTAQKRYYESMLLEEADSAFLRLFERFLEAAPQVTLQLCFLLTHLCDNSTAFEDNYKSIAASVVSLAWSLTVFNSTSRTTTQGEQWLTSWGKLFQFLWHLCMISSRVSALAFFASVYPVWVAPACGVHWLIMLTWLNYQSSSENKGEPNKAESEVVEKAGCSRFSMGSDCARIFCARGVFAFVYTFTYFNTVDEPTKLKYAMFYLVCFIENTIFIASAVNSTTPARVLWAAVGSYGLFCLGFVFMFAYFTWFHPSLKFSSVGDALRYLFSFKTGVPESSLRVVSAVVSGDKVL